MFSYYGSKSKIAHLYPAPKFDRIIEPFAGSARYSLLHFENDVQLYDANPVIADIWKFLINATEKDILSLPDVSSKVSLDTFTQLSDVERNLIGFHMCRGKAKPRKVGHGQNDWNRAKLRIAASLHKIRHWKIENWDAFGLTVWLQTSRSATWFIDPPYQRVQISTNGDRYPYGDAIDYTTLAEFVKTRNGQVIVCEGEGADWLPFELLTTVNANTNNKTVKKKQEWIYSA